MLVTTKEILPAARQGRYGIPAPDFIDVDSARVFVRVAEEQNKPLILSYAQALEGILPLEEAAAIGKVLAENTKVPVALHLDHGEDFDFIRRSIELGFSSVMLDASMESYEENVYKTTEVVQYAHARGVTVEAEIGHVGHGESVADIEETETIYTEVDEAVRFVKETGVDSLAVSIGTVHGIYKNLKAPQLNFDRLCELAAAVPVPLVLHGASGSGEANLRRCVADGISKINIFTDFLTAAMDEIHTAGPQTYLALKQSANAGMKRVLESYYDMFAAR